MTKINYSPGYLARYAIFIKGHLPHFESGKELWLQGEAALRMPSFRDGEPQLVIPAKTKKNLGLPPVQLRQEINICLTTTDPCLPLTA